MVWYGRGENRREDENGVEILGSEMKYWYGERKVVQWKSKRVRIPYSFRERWKESIGMRVNRVRKLG